MFPNKVINFLNKLTDSVLLVPSTACFKKHWRKFVNNVDTEFCLPIEVLM